MTEWLCLTLVLLAVSLLLYLYRFNQSFHYYSKFTFYAFASTIGSLYVILMSAPRPRNVLNTKHYIAPWRLISKCLNIKWEFRGRDILANCQGCVIVSNHQTSLDAIGIPLMSSEMYKFTAVAKKEVLYTGPFGLAAWITGGVLLDRSNPERARVSMAETKKLLTDKVNLWIFPEGTRHNDNSIHPFKKGAFHTAVSAQVPILPVVYSPYNFINAEKKFFDSSGLVIATALHPIPTEGLTVDDIPDLIEKTRTAMITCYEAVTKELRATLPPDYPGLYSK